INCEGTMTMLCGSLPHPELEAVMTMAGFFFFTDPATTEIYTLSLHDALPISSAPSAATTTRPGVREDDTLAPGARLRSEEHTSELQSHHDLVCRLLLEKKKTKKNYKYSKKKKKKKTKKH